MTDQIPPGRYIQDISEEVATLARAMETSTVAEVSALPDQLRAIAEKLHVLGTRQMRDDADGEPKPLPTEFHLASTNMVAAKARLDRAYSDAGIVAEEQPNEP